MFHRIRNSPDELPSPSRNDRALADNGWLWLRLGTEWIVTQRILSEPAKLLDVQAEPTIHEGDDDDVAVTARGLCWRKSAGRWQFDADLGNAETARLTIRDCRVTGNLTLPIVESWVPLYDSRGRAVGKLKVYPNDAE